MKPHIILLLLSLLTGCVTRSSVPPRASTATIGAQLNNLETSLGKARGSVNAVKNDLSYVDSKAVKIKEALRHW